MTGAPTTAVSEQALAVIEGESYARGFLRRVQAGTAHPADLATLMGFLDGDMLIGACRVLCKALEGVQHA